MPLTDDQLKAMEPSAPLLVAEVRRLRALIDEVHDDVAKLLVEDVSAKALRDRAVLLNVWEATGQE